MFVIHIYDNLFHCWQPIVSSIALLIFVNHVSYLLSFCVSKKEFLTEVVTEIFSSCWNPLQLNDIH